jgi:hypothetical protein
MTLLQKIDQIIALSQAKTVENMSLKAEIVDLKQQLADAIAAKAADNTAHQAEADEAAAKLDAELAAVESGATDAAVAKLDEAIASLTPVEIPVAIEVAEMAPVEELVAA